MDLSRAKEYLNYAKLQLEGEAVQFRYRDRSKCCDAWDAFNNDFHQFKHVFFNDEDLYEFRIKPEPKLRPWRPEEVPVGALMRNKKDPRLYRSLILCVNDTGYCIVIPNGCSNTLDSQSMDGMLRLREHSLDHGKTWLPCGVLES